MRVPVAAAAEAGTGAGVIGLMLTVELLSFATPSQRALGVTRALQAAVPATMNVGEGPPGPYRTSAAKIATSRPCPAPMRVVRKTTDQAGRIR